MPACLKYGAEEETFSFICACTQGQCTLQLSTWTRTASAGGNLSYFCSITSFSVSVLQKQRYCTVLPTQLPCIQSCLSLFFSLSIENPNIKKATRSRKLLFQNPRIQNAESQVLGLGVGELGKTKHNFFLKACFTNKKNSIVSFFSSDSLKKHFKLCIFFLLLHKKNGRIS